MTKPRILVTRKLPEAVEVRLASRFDVQFNTSDKPMSAEALMAAMRGFDAIVPTVSDKLDADILNAPNRQVRMIANVGVGFNNIDIETARREGIAVSNTPDVLTEATANIAMLLILSVTRGAYAAETKLREQRWSGFSIVEGLGSSIQGKTLGIIGMGRIGQATARKAARGFGMNTIYYNRSPLESVDFEAEKRRSISEVMSEADVVSIHVPGGGLKPLVTAEHIASMKPSAYLINTARGDSLDQAALITALQEGRIAGAGLDVFENEPAVPEELRVMKNVTLLPHIGSATIEVRTAMGMLAADNLEAFFDRKVLPNPVVEPGV
ncbi:MAG: D-glycerate dehydrogenase [Litorimonas sp.]